MRRLHRPCRRQGGALLRAAAVKSRPGAEGRDHRRPRAGQPAASGAAGLRRGAGGAVRLLHQRHDHGIGRVPQRQQESLRGGYQKGARQQYLPLRHPHPHRARGQARRRSSVREAAMTKHFSPSRRDLLKGGGALIVSFSLADQALAEQAAAQRPLSIAEVDAFLTIDARGRVTVYSGKVDLGTGVRTALAQMAAEELDVPFNVVRIVEGDTALTPDQGTTWGSLSIQAGGVQIRNAAATARAALINAAAKRLDAKPEELSVSNGVIRAGNRRVSYG